MKEWKEVKDLRSKIISIEMELALLSNDLVRFKQELNYNQKILEKIEENIEFLKNSNAIVSLVEFRKIKQHKKLIEMKILNCIKKVQPLERLFSTKETTKKQELERFENLYRLQFKDNILEFSSDRRKKA